MAIRYLSGINVDSNTLFVDDANNRVGIGTASPTSSGLGSSPALLNIYRASGNAGLTLTIGSDAWDIANVGGNGLWFIYNNSIKAVITNAGNVGIGTTSPSEALHIYRNAASAEIRLQNNTISSYIRSNTDNLNFYVSNGEKMRITSGGNVGIGTTSPVKTLDVSGNARISTAYSNVALSTITYAQLQGLPFILSDTTLDNNAGQVVTGIGFGYSNEITSAIVVTDKGGSGSQSIDFITGSTASLSPKMSIDYNGDVGIGVTSPSYKLHVDGTIRSSNLTIADGMYHEGDTNTYINFLTDQIQLATAGSVRAYISPSGNVGIGTTSPSSKLQVSGDTYVTGQFAQGVAVASKIAAYGAEFRSSGASAQIFFGRSDSSVGSGAIGADSSYAFTVWSLPSFGRLLVVNQNGNVGIGTTSPATKLHIAGSSSDTAGTGLLRIEGGGGGGNVSWTFRSTVTNNDLTLDRQYAGAYYQALTFQRSTGNVGIGTASPVEKLELSGTSNIYGRITSTNGANAGIRFNSSGATEYGIFSDGALRFYDFTAATERMRITSVGKVGIGNTAPNAKLDIVSTASGSEGLRVDGASGGFAFVVKAGSDYTSHIRAGATIGVNYFTTPPSNGLIVEGNVGIGTTSPAANLHVNGTWTSDRGTISINGPANALTGIGITSNNIYRGGLIHRDGTAGQSLELTAYSSEHLLLKTANTTRLAITPGGNVGIGTTTPTAPLHIEGGTNSEVLKVEADASPYIRWVENGTDVGFLQFLGDNAYLSNMGNGTLFFRTNNTDKMVITNSGNVGIGTTSPSAKLHLSGTGNQGTQAWFGNGFINVASYHYDFARVGFSVEDADGGDTGAGFMFNTRNSSDTNWMHGYIYQPQDGGIAFGTGGAGTTQATEKLRITSGGNVGIGTTSPSSKLHIKQSVDSIDGGLTWESVDGTQEWSIDANNAGNFRIYKGTTAVARFNSSGNLGIGTTSPSYKLDVNGESRVQGQFRITGNNIVGGYTDITGVIYHRNDLTSLNKAGTGWVGWAIRNTSGSETVTDLQNIGTFSASGAVTLSNYGAGYLKSDASGNITVDADIIEDTLDSVTDRGNTTTNNITVGNLTANGNITTNTGIFYSGNAAKLDLNQYNAGYLRLLTDNTERVRITATGNVGIGTTSPTSKLDVSGTISITGTNATGQESILLQFNAGSDQLGSIRTYNAGAYNQHTRFYTSNVSGTGETLAFMYDQSGKVGIGTTSPTHQLQVHNSSGSGSQVNFTDSVTTALDGSGLRVGWNGTYGQLYLFENSYLRFGTNNTERMRIDASGNVGIGTTNPGYKLDVDGEVRADAYRIDLSATTQRALSSTGTDSLQIGDAGVNDIRFKNASGTSLTLNSSGNVGIGTISPSTKLHVVGDARIEGNLTINGTVTQIDTDTLTTEQWLVTNDGTGPAVVINQKGSQPVIDIQDDGTSVMYIEDGGNVGIGTTSPAYKLDVNGQGFFTSGIITNTTVAIKLKQAAGTLNDATEFRTGGGEFKIYSGRDAGAHQAFVFATGDNYTSGSERMRITDAGQVAIGRTTPYAIGGTAKLSVEGTFTIGAGTTDLAYFRKFGAGNLQIQTYDNGNVGELQLQPYGGNVGIGTTSPAYKLDVNGQIVSNNATAGRLSTISGTRNINIQSFSGDWNYLRSNGANFVIGTEDASTNLYLRTNDSDRLIITSTGNVGVGTTNPTQRLSVAGNTDLGNSVGSTLSSTHTTKISGYAMRYDASNRYGNYGVLILNSDSGWTASARKFMLTSGLNTNKFAIIRSVDADTDPAFGDGGAISSGTADFVIDNSGNVGIGTTSPTQKLDIAGNIKLSNNSYVSWRNAANNADVPLLQLTSGNDFNIGTTSSSVPATIKFHTNSTEQARFTSGGQFIVGGTTVGYAGTKLQVGNTSDSQNGLNILTSATGYGYILFGDGAGAATYSGQITYYHGDNHMGFNTNNGERMRITSDGKVGIGTTSPNHRVDIYSNENVPLRIHRPSNANLDSSGAWGIGFSTRSDANNSTTDTRAGIFSYYNGNLFLAAANTSIVADPDAYARLTILNTGYVGIGTISPSQELHVSGNVRVTGAYYDSNNSAGTSGQILKSTGTGTDWVTLSEITGVDGTGTANYIAKWSDTDTIANSQIQDNGTTVGIGQAPGDAKLSVAGNSIKAGGKLAYTHNESSLDTTGVAVAGLTTGGNGVSALFTFTMYGGQRHYQKVVYSCQNAAGTWYVDKVIDEGTNGLDVVASADSGSTITFTFKASSSTQYYSPAVHVECLGASINTTYL